MTMNPTNAFKIIIYNTQHTKNTKVHFIESKNVRKCRIVHKSIFSKIVS